MIYLRRGDRLPIVAVVQHILNELGAGGTSPLNLDGAFGPATIAAVRVFQRANNTAARSVVDPATWSVMRQRGNYSVVDIVDMAFDDALQR